MDLHDMDRTEAFVELLTLHQRTLYGFIYTLVPNSYDAEDLLQQSSLILWQKFKEFDLDGDFKTWAFQIAHFEVLNFLKKKRRSRVCFNDELIAKLADVRKVRDEAHPIDQSTLLDCVEKLGDSDRRLIKACYSTIRSIKAVAAELGRPVGSVYTSLSKIRHLLLDCMRKATDEEGRK